MRLRLLPLGLILAAGIGIAAPAAARQENRAGGKLLLTNAVTSVEGSSGGGLATWAVIAGNETRDGYGFSAHVTYVPLADYGLTSYGAAIGIKDRVELSYARERFDTKAVGTALGLGHGFTFDEDVFGAKVRLFGDVVYDGWLPEVSVGAQYKKANRGAVIALVGGQHDHGVDYYASATKVLLGQSLVVNTTVRFTKANQFGLLGFGGDKNDSYKAEFEGSAGLLLTRKILVGAEVRTKPDNLRFAREDAVYDGFVAYAVARNLSLTAAYVDLGSIATVKGQRGAFLSLQTSF
jgi:hypothetical protein